MISGSAATADRFINGKQTDISAFAAVYPFESRFMEIGGHAYHYIDQGNGDPVVMIHGNPTWSFYYRSLISALSPSYRTIAPDHIGCGLSDKPAPEYYSYRLDSRIADLTEFLNRLDITGRITLIVHDWGGMIGSAYAVSNPERISRMIVLNTAAFFPPKDKPIPKRLKIVRDFKLAEPLVLGLNLFSAGALVMASKKGLSRKARAGLTAPYNSWKNRIATLAFVRDIPLDENDPSYETVRQTSAALSRLSAIPMLICWGMRDFVFDSDYLAEWARRFPNAEIHRFPDAGHYVLEDESGKIVQIIREFLQNHPL